MPQFLPTSLGKNWHCKFLCPENVTIIFICNRDEVDDLQTLDSCEYIWAPGVGFAHRPADTAQYDLNRRELLRLLETCFSQVGRAV